LVFIYIHLRSPMTTTLSPQNASAQTRSTLVIIDPAVTEAQTLANGVIDGAIALILNPDQDGIQQITAAQRQHNATVLHIICHGEPGCLSLGNTQLDLNSLSHYTEALQLWFEPALDAAQAPQLLLYGCQVAAGGIGTSFLDALHRLTGANIAASTTPTGNPQQGGDWKLERAIGRVDAPLAFRSEVMEQYAGVLFPTLARFLHSTPNSNAASILDWNSFRLFL
jgi:hypothetical protein